MRKIIFSICILLTSTAFAETPPATDTLLSAPHPIDARTNEVVTFKTKDMYHFNQKVPQMCGSSRAPQSTDPKAQSLDCQFASPGEQKVSLKICDDKETFCRTEDFKVEVSGAPGVTASLPAVSQQADPAPIEGFLKNVPDEAIRQAKASDKLLIIDFYGIWCPPCNVLEERVLSTKEFRDATKTFVRLSLDSDAEVSWPLKSRFHVQGLPTLLVAVVNQKGELEEIGRRYEASLPVVLAWISKQQKLKSESLEKAQAMLAKNPTPERKVRVAQSLMDQQKFEDARALLKGLPSHEARYLDTLAQVKSVSDAPKTTQIEILKNAIDRFDGTNGEAAEPEILSWLESLAQLDKAAALAYAPMIDQWITKLKSSARSAEEGEDVGDLLETAGSIYEVLEQPDKAKSHFSQAADYYAEQAKHSSRKVSRGLNQNRATCLLHADRNDEAEKIYQSLIEQYPGEYTFHFNYARALFKLKKYPQSLRELARAEPLAYGDNWLRTLELKARVLLAQKNKADARKTVALALSRIELPKDPTLWVHRDYKDLVALQEEIKSTAQ